MASILAIIVLVGGATYAYRIPKIMVYTSVDFEKDQKIIELWDMPWANDHVQMDTIAKTISVSNENGAQAPDGLKNPDYIVQLTPSDHKGGSFFYHIWVEGDSLKVRMLSEPDRIYQSDIPTNKFLAAIQN